MSRARTAAFVEAQAEQAAAEPIIEDPATAHMDPDDVIRPREGMPPEEGPQPVEAAPEGETQPAAQAPDAIEGAQAPHEPQPAGPTAEELGQRLNGAVQALQQARAQ